MSSTRSLAIALVVIAVSSGGAHLAAQRPGDTLPASVGDLTVAQLVEIRDPAGQVLLHGTLKTSKREPKQTERKADLVSPTGQRATGKVGIEIDSKNGAVEKEAVELSFDRLPKMTECQFFLDGRQVSSFTTDKDGKAAVKLERKAASNPVTPRTP
jgi:hypothetical protein